MNHAVTTHRRRALPAGLLLLLAACSSGDGDGSGPPGLASSPPASTFTSDVAVEWHELLYLRVKAGGIPPPRAARIFGYAGLALYETVVPGMSAHQTLQGQLNGFPAATLPVPANRVHHWPAAANRALAVVAGGLISGSAAEFDALEQQFLDVYTTEVSASVLARSVQWGEDVGNAILAWAATDGIAGVDACGAAYVPPPEYDEPSEGAWTQVSGAAAPLLPCWGDVRTFVVPASDSCAAIGPPPFSTGAGSPWYAHALLVYNTTGDAGANLTDDEKAIAAFWADNPVATGTPPGHWIATCCQVSAEEGLALDAAAELFARVGMVVHDAFVTCWETKYQYYLQRPATYIRANIDAAWDPFIGTPNFPTYTSGHSTQSGAAATVLTGFFGPHAYTDTTHSRLNPELLTGPDGALYADRNFASFHAAASDAAVSRMFGGIHYLFDNYDGFDQGACIGAIHNATLRFLATD